MLDVIADFWKPVRKAQTQEKLQPELLQVGKLFRVRFRTPDVIEWPPAECNRHQYVPIW